MDESTVDESGVGRDELLAALDRVLASTPFARAPRSRAFLAFVVTEAAAGRGARLSERTVGRRALGHGPDFDGRHDASVRVRASRVRDSLRAYYSDEGAADPVRIELPPGGYAPVAHRAPRAASTAVARGPGLAVERFRADGEDAAALAAMVGDGLVTRLQGLGTVAVIGPLSGRDVLAVPGRAPGVSTVLSGAVIVNASVARLSGRLVAVDDGAVLWSHSQDVELAGRGALEAADDWARQVAARLADHTGVVLRQWARRSGRVDDIELQARLAWYRYLEAPTVDHLERAVARLDGALASGGRAPALLAMRGALANARVIHGTTPDTGKELQLAEDLAREALTADVRNAHAHLVLGGVARARREWELAVHHAEEAGALSRDSPAQLFAAGMLIAAAGQWARGLAEMEAAVRLDPDLPANVRLWFALAHAVLGDYARSLAASSVLGADTEPYATFFRAMALAGLGYGARAREEVLRLLELEPPLYGRARAVLTDYQNVSDEDVDRLVGLLEGVGPDGGASPEPAGSS